MRTHSADRQRVGFTRIELVVTAGMALLAAGLLLPRVQAARAEAARTQCQSNLRKLGAGFQEFEKAHGGFPPRRTGFGDGAPYGGWGPFLLPHIGEAELAKRYNFKLDCFDPGNKAVVETVVSAFVCPAAPGERKVTIQAQATAKSENPNKDKVYTVDGGVSDYISCNTVLMPRGGYGLNARDTDQMGGNQRQAMADDVYLPAAKITDGLSCTLVLIEQAGRPAVWRNGKKQDGGGQFGMSANARGAWAGWGSIGFGPAGADGISAAKGDSTDCSVNCNNWFGIYGFHTGGANVLMCDGSVRFVGPKLDPLTFAYLSIRDDGHLISTDDY
jgi:prepilin-type processing-associated H-X9-DG protein